MTTHLNRGLAALALGLCLTAVASAAPTDDPELAKGAAQVADGDYQGAIGTLSAAVRRLQAAPGREKEAAAAYLQLGVAYAGLDQASPAVSQFYQALRRDAAIRLDAKAPPRAQELFAEALAQAQVETAPAVAKRRGGKGKLLGILVGGAAVAGAGIAAAGQGDSGPGPGEAPVISNLVLHPIVASGSGVGFFVLEFDYRDADGDVTSAAVRAPDAPALNPLPDATGRMSGHTGFTQAIVLPARGTPLAVAVSVNDRSGHISNVLTGTTSLP